jgi:hypothetical protein
MNILERWKVAKIGERVYSAKHFTFIKDIGLSCASCLLRHGVPDDGMFDDWPELPKKKYIIHYLGKVTGKDLKHVTIQIPITEDSDKLKVSHLVEAIIKWEE